MKFDAVVIGAGLSGITVAERLAQKNYRVLVVEKRAHIGGNCYDEYDRHHILVHRYGPHIFHTRYKEVWKYLSRFTDWLPYKHKVLTYVKGQLLPFPVNRTTLNKFFGVNLKTKKEVEKFLAQKRDNSIKKIENSRDVVLSRYGQEIYEAFVENYSKKQWGLSPEKLDREVLERFPLRYDDNPYYFTDPYQGIPKYGYTRMFQKMLEHPRIQILLQQDYREILEQINYKLLFVSAPIDEFFNYRYGKLLYRCLNFKFETYNRESYQPNSVINYPTKEYKFTRITEMKKLTMQKSAKTTICKEYPGWKGVPCYPVPTPDQKKLYARYAQLASQLKNVFFIGRLGTYRYLNMDQACKFSLDLVKKL